MDATPDDVKDNWYISVKCEPKLPRDEAANIQMAIASSTPGVSHVEINAEEHLPLVRELGITRTPTTFILDANGTIRGKASGLPKRSEVTQSLAALL